MSYFLLFLRNTLSACITVVEGLAGMAAHSISGAARSYAKSRLTARQAVVKSLPEKTQRRVARVVPVSTFLFDQATTDASDNTLMTASTSFAYR